MQSYSIESWRKSTAVHRTSAWKQGLYCLARPALSAYWSRRVDRNLLRDLRPQWVIGPRGMPLEARRRWAIRNLDIRRSSILVQGTGTGWDAVLWASLRPHRVMAVDLFPFEESWDEIREFCKEQWGVPVEFAATPLEAIAGVGDGGFDLCVSDAVFEHCTDLAAVMRESRRVLRPGGFLYASYGPLWFSPGGDHFSGRGGLGNVYAHLELAPSAYDEYFRRYLGDTEQFQSGGRYVELGLFSRLATRDYLRLFRAEGFKCQRLILEMSPEAFRFEREFPDRFAALVRSLSGRCGRDDLRIRSNLVRLRRE